MIRAVLLMTPFAHPPGTLAIPVVLIRDGHYFHAHTLLPPFFRSLAVESQAELCRQGFEKALAALNAMVVEVLGPSLKK